MAGFSSNVPMRASDFLSTLGVDTHIPYTDGGYVNLGNVVADLQYLGITQIRNSLSDGSYSSAPLSSDIYLAKQGIKFTTFVETSTTAGLNYILSLIDQVNEAVPGSITAVEGPNEINNFLLTFNGVSGLQGAIDLQKALYAGVHSDPNLPGIPVDYFTGYDMMGIGPNPYTTAVLADYDTQHPYPTYGQAPAWFVSPSQSLPNEGPVYGPAVYTETGYSTYGGSSGGLVPVNQDVQAKYTLDLLMDAAKDGISKTYLYQLMDAYQPGSPQGDDGFGLFDPNNAPKEAATAIHNLTSILAANGTGSNTFTTTPLNYSVAGLPSTGNNMLMEKSNGAYEIVVWNEPKIWNESTGTEITAPTVNVDVQLGGTYSKVEVFDPLVGSTPVQTLAQVSSVQLGITDHPLIVETISAPINTQPNLTVSSDSNATRGQVINLSFLVTVNDPDSVGYKTFELWDSNGTVAGGEFVVNGVAQTGGHEIDVAPANVANTVFDAGTLGGTDTLAARLLQDNGTLTPWQEFTVTVTEPPPPVQTPIESTASMTAGAALNWSSLFGAASAPSGATVNEYWVTASNPSVGQWYENGQPVSGAITPAQLSELTFDALGPGSETIYLQATDNGGVTWSAWQGNGVTVTVTEPPPPVQTPIELTASMTAGAALNWSSLFGAASAPSGATVNEYWVTASNPSVGQWYENGQPVSGAITPAQLSELTFDALGPGSETIYLQATDNGGVTWSAWQGNGVRVTVPTLSVASDNSATSLTIADGATVELSSAYAGAVTFAGSTGTLQLDNSSSFSGTVAGMTGQDTIDFADINFTKVQTPSYSGNSSGGSSL